MRTSLLLLIIGLTLFVNSLAQKQNGLDQKQPRMVFLKSTYDFGKVKQGEKPKCVFTFVNKGKSPLIISNVKTSCGCTVPFWPKKPVLPADSSTIEVTFSAEQPGTFEKFIDIYSNAREVVWLRIKGTVITEVIKEKEQRK